eukprot:TRINITY_DN4931_c0_g1_i1.p1 TRINITY_DN4931_c0_g1~~TRINITY_DN4931_c0_g1_i1.p1  ORF type:complete len:245 (-),score=59.75 TRINITY_DN4931_c0_g1_i1:385-1119(-)
MSTITLQVPINFSVSNTFCNALNKKRINFGLKFQQPTNYFSLSRSKIEVFHRKVGSNLRVVAERCSFSIRKEKVKKRVVLVRFNSNRFGFNGGGDNDDNNTARVLGNLALAVGLTYLSMTGQLGWILDAIVSIWLLAVLLPIVGLGAFLWFAGRDIVQDSCPNCGNDFQIFKSSLQDGMQLCPFCSQPFSVKGNKFIRESVKFSPNQSTTFGQAFNGFSPRTEKGKASSATTVVDIEAEVKDID